LLHHDQSDGTCDWSNFLLVQEDEDLESNVDKIVEYLKDPEAMHFDLSWLGVQVEFFRRICVSLPGS
jgi:hypothetical protein